MSQRRESPEARARRDLEEHMVRLRREIEEGRGGGSGRLAALTSLADSRGVPLYEVVAAADAGELRSIIDLPDRRTALAQAKARQARLDAMRRNWS